MDALLAGRMPLASGMSDRGEGKCDAEAPEAPCVVPRECGDCGRGIQCLGLSALMHDAASAQKRRGARRYVPAQPCSRNAPAAERPAQPEGAGGPGAAITLSGFERVAPFADAHVSLARAAGPAAGAAPPGRAAPAARAAPGPELPHLPELRLCRISPKQAPAPAAAAAPAQPSLQWAAATPGGGDGGGGGAQAGWRAAQSSPASGPGLGRGADGSGSPYVGQRSGRGGAAAPAAPAAPAAGGSGRGGRGSWGMRQHQLAADLGREAGSAQRASAAPGAPGLLWPLSVRPPFIRDGLSMEGCRCVRARAVVKLPGRYRLSGQGACVWRTTCLPACRHGASGVLYRGARRGAARASAGPGSRRHARALRGARRTCGAQAAAPPPRQGPPEGPRRRHAHRSPSPHHRHAPQPQPWREHRRRRARARTARAPHGCDPGRCRRRRRGRRRPRREGRAQRGALPQARQRPAVPAGGLQPATADAAGMRRSPSHASFLLYACSWSSPRCLLPGLRLRS